ncbi:hypothetical protein ENKO_38220 [Enterobacter kobei]|jgi:hypothetical protein|uniref:Uncharacterized protein n=1 Tax=Enterobacter kobei TaxID=208224 RepID=A0AA86IVA2_9ENTR|nr:hypothetical protein ENKO_38220 [Enterobacter kobei]
MTGGERRHTVIKLTLFQPKIPHAAISVEQITAATALSTSKWKTTRYKLLTFAVSFNPETLTG